VLDLCKGGMLGKHDAFKVVLYPATDPGADKHGLLGSGQVLPIWENTGGTDSMRSFQDFSSNYFEGRSGKGAGIGAAQLP
jgi:hypothetical protein